MTSQTERHIAYLFNKMAAEYDQLEDEWYPHLFRQIERVVRRHASDVAGDRAIDVGCGTGFQTTILEGLGYQTVGIDIAGDLVTHAREKLAATGSRAQFCVASALDIPFPAGWFDLVNCAGSTLSFIPDYPRALREMARVLRPGGCLVLEVEQRWNLDLVWGLVDAVSGGAFGYEQSLSEAVANLRRPADEGIEIAYPFTHLDGSRETLPLHCFALPELAQASRGAGLRVGHVYSVHSVTNLLPSVWLSDPHLHPLLRFVARLLARPDEWVSGWWPFRSLGCSAILVLRKEVPSPWLQKQTLPAAASGYARSPHDWAPPLPASGERMPALPDAPAGKATVGAGKTG